MFNDSYKDEKQEVKFVKNDKKILSGHKLGVKPKNTGEHLYLLACIYGFLINYGVLL